jgi:hypothetical protein
MNTKQIILNKLKNARKQELSKKVDLSLVDDINYEFEYLQEEVGRMSYVTEEWFDEKFEEFYQLRSDLRTIYFQNSESFIDSADVAGDKEVLLQIKVKTDELGIPVEDVYPDYEEHLASLDYLDYIEGRFEEQKRELENLGL